MTALKNVIGQDRAKQMLELLGNSFNRRKKLPPIGIFGPSGLGKTHLVNEFSDWLGAKLIYINGTAVKDALAFRAYIKDAERNPGVYHVVFVDECHNLPRKVQENLLSVLEEPSILCTIAPKDVGHVKCVDGNRYINKGDIMQEQLPDNMSFVFATTDPVMLKDTVLNRLRKIQLEPYALSDKVEIAMTHLSSKGAVSTYELCKNLAQRSRSIRQLKGELCETYLDIEHTVEGDDLEMKLDLLDDLLGLDEDGATDMDLDYLHYLANHNIAGVDTLAGVLKTDKREVIGRIEPFLLEKGWIYITGKGRRLTQLGHQKMFGEDEDDNTTE